MTSSPTTNTVYPPSFTSLVRKGESLECYPNTTEVLQKWGGDGYKYEQIITAPDGKVFSKKVWRVISKPTLEEWTKAVNHHIEHGA